MIRIVFICSLISIARSEQCTLNDNELHRLQTGLAETVAYMKQQDRSDAMIFIAPSNAGKSTIINYLMGNKLKAVKLSRTWKIRIEKADKTTPGPAIEAGILSKNTTTPSRWTSSLLPDLAIWDSPGFSDNRGPVVDITNAFYLYELLKNVNSLKIVLVINYEDITGDNVGPFLTFLKYLETIFGQSFEDFFPSITVIFSKAPYQDDSENKIDQDFMSVVLDGKFLLSNIPDISETSTNFMKYIKENNDRISFFRMAKRVGDLPSNIADNIVEAIKGSSFIRKEYLENLHPSISQQSKLCLYSARKDLLADPKLGDLKNFVTYLLNE